MEAAQPESGPHDLGTEAWMQPNGPIPTPIPSRGWPFPASWPFHPAQFLLPPTLPQPRANLMPVGAPELALVTLDRHKWLALAQECPLDCILSLIITWDGLLAVLLLLSSVPSKVLISGYHLLKDLPFWGKQPCCWRNKYPPCWRNNSRTGNVAHSYLSFLERLTGFLVPRHSFSTD